MGENSLKKVIILKITLYKLKIKLIVYTFGTPRGLAEEPAQPFQNVFNFVFGADVVTYVAPYFPVSGYTSEKESIEWLSYKCYSKYSSVADGGKQGFCQNH